MSDSAHVSSAPVQPGQPWNAFSRADIGGWSTLDQHSGPVSLATGRSTGQDFPSGRGWQQT